MKFLVVTNHSYMLWRFRRELIEALLQRGEVVISTPFVGHEQDFCEIGCRCIEAGIDRRGKNLNEEAKLFLEYRKLLKKEKPDLVITYSIKPNLYVGLLCRQLGVPFCANVQGLGTAFQSKKMAVFVSAFYRIALKNARTVFFENEGNASEFLKRRILQKDKITVLSGAGINLESFPLKLYPSENKGIHFLYVGRIMREKGMDELFPVMIRLKKEYGERVNFDLVGFFEDDYKQTVEDLERKGIVSFFGFQENTEPFYASAHCIVLPSWHEGMSNVLLEAAATGRALITSDIPGCREAVDQDSGLLINVRDQDSLYSAMKAFLDMSQEQRENMGLSGRRKMEEEFDKKRVVEETLSALGV